MEGTSVHRLLALISLLSHSTNQVHLTVSPSRSQFFEGESMNLTCEDEDRSAGWTVKRITTRGSEKPCGDGWGKPAGSSCSLTYLVQSDFGVYWCESTSGSSSNTIQLSVSGGSVILQSPVLPVMEGHDVTLRCHDQTFSNLPAAFYKYGSFIGHETTGNLIINQVKKSDEGHYKCNIRGQGESPSSRIWVKEKPRSTAPPTTEAPPLCVAPPSSSSPLLIVTLLCHLVVMFLFFICSFILGFLSGLRAKGSDLSPCVKMTPPPQADLVPDDGNDDVTTEHHF